MKKTEFKVHTIYTDEDILQMEKVSTQKMRRLSLAVSGMVFVLYVAVIFWETLRGQGHASLFSSIPGNVLNAVLLAALALSILFTLYMPYYRRRRILKSVPGGVLKANYYFYEKTFQYGWGDNFVSVAYVSIEEFRNLPNTFFIRADSVAYWVKKSDFEVGTAEEFLEFMSGKLRCGIK